MKSPVKKPIKLISDYCSRLRRSDPGRCPAPDASYIFERSPRHPVLGCPFYLHYLCLRYQPSRCGYRNLLVLLRADGGSIGSGPAA